ncbi:EAL domain-containing protein [Saliniramus sp.]|uniref:EAL domain-containing protein n=1 Tax=Saliniramus sp. TaxID=2986772 RepID=UPI002CADF989|nr:EAL domain-containing protein [Saliniramus sp.]HMB11243.1 EAL domain-containing protein [Saliniramus sp.]
MGSIRNWALWAVSAVAIIASAIALWSLFGAALEPGMLLAGVGAIAVFTFAAAGFWRAGRASGLAAKTAHDLDIVARRLLRLEARLAEIERHPHAETRKTVAEVSGEIALLSGLLRDLAGSVSGHDRDVATLAEEIVGLRERLDGAALMRAADMRAAEPSQPADAADGGTGWAGQLSDLAPAGSIGEEGISSPDLSVAPAMGETAPLPLTPQEPAANDRDAQIGGVSAVEDALFSAPPEPPEPATDPAEEVRKRAIIQAFREDHLEIHLQPVVNLPQRKTRFYEALARLRLDEQTLLQPDEFLPVLEESQLLPELDGKVAARAAAVARHLVNRGSEGFVSCNLAGASVRTPGFLRALGRILEAYPDILGRLAFEIPQRAWRMLDAESAGALEQLRAKGAFFILDRATDMRLDPLSLADRGVAYAKLPARMLLDPQPSHGLDFETADLATVLGRAGIRLVADKVETESDVPDLIDIDVPLAQGYVFAPPRAVRPDIVAGLARRATPPQSAPPSRSGTAQQAGNAGADGSRAAGNTATQRSIANRSTMSRSAAGTDSAGNNAASKNATGKNAPSRNAANPPPGAPTEPPDPPEPRLPYRAFLRRAG